MGRQAEAVDFHLGGRLRARREALGLTQDQLAERLGISAAEVRLYEDGSKKIPPRRLVQAAETLGPSLQWFLEGSLGGPCQGPLNQASRDIMRFLAMPEAYLLISAFVSISSSELRRSVILHAQAASQSEGAHGPEAVAAPERGARS